MGASQRGRSSGIRPLDCVWVFMDVVYIFVRENVFNVGAPLYPAEQMALNSVHYDSDLRGDFRCGHSVPCHSHLSKAWDGINPCQDDGVRILEYGNCPTKPRHRQIEYQIVIFF